MVRQASSKFVDLSQFSLAQVMALVCLELDFPVLFTSEHFFLSGIIT
jgi:hypothetical protein